MTSTEVLARVGARYAAAKTYSDHGTVSSKAGGFVHAQTFQTAFARPDKVYFEFSDSMLSSRYVIWTAPGGYKSWWSVQPTKVKQDKLDVALGGAYGVSNEASGYILGLLMGGVLWHRTPTEELTDVRLDAPQSVGGHACYVVHGLGHHQSQTLWVAKDSFLILRRVTREVVDPKQLSLTPEEKQTLEKTLTDKRIDAGVLFSGPAFDAEDTLEF
jgi:hypothetical protein